jgi:hypothetical protein
MGERKWRDKFPITSCIWYASMIDLQERFTHYLADLYSDGHVLCRTNYERHELEISLIDMNRKVDSEVGILVIEPITDNISSMILYAERQGINIALAVLTKLESDFELHHADFNQIPIEEIVNQSEIHRIAPDRPADLDKWKAVWNYIKPKHWLEMGMSPAEIRESLEKDHTRHAYHGKIYSIQIIKKIIRSGRADELS